MQPSLIGQTIFPYGRLLISVRTTANRAAISRVKRKIYPRMYPITLVLANGASLQMRYHEPRHILQVRYLHAKRFPNPGYCYPVFFKLLWATRYFIRGPVQ
ncbi:hypothetical protein AHF37_02733 [Paragonimus kellicotti]|nr:hypothetical protein AHF37_02733 [Paragonimus kellicotti]